MLDFFNHSHSFYTLKELEKEGSRYTKIPSIAVKNIVQELIDDGVVNCEKCGTTNLYWCFKYDQYEKVKKQHQHYSRKIKEKQQEREQLIERIHEEKNRRKEKSEFGSRNELLERLTYLRTEEKSLQESLNDLQENDADKALKRNTELAKAIETCTEAIESLVYYFTKLSPVHVNEQQLRQELGLPPEFEDINAPTEL